MCVCVGFLSLGRFFLVGLDTGVEGLLLYRVRVGIGVGIRGKGCLRSYLPVLAWTLLNELAHAYVDLI